jgi:hypothetical protein
MFGSKFTPRLEELGARITPASKPSGGGDIAFAHVAVAGQAGEEIPQTGSAGGHAHGAWVGVDPFASKPSSGGDINI